MAKYTLMYGVLMSTDVDLGTWQFTMYSRGCAFNQSQIFIHNYMRHSNYPGKWNERKASQM